MKKLTFFLIIVFFCFALNVNAQHNGLKKITGGVIYAACGTIDFSGTKQPFAFGQNLLLNTCFVTNKTYHNCVYGLANNTIKVVNGIPFGGYGLDFYFVPGYNFSTDVGSFSTGIERKMNDGSDVTFFLFAEVGKEIKPGSGTTFSIGFHVNIQSTLYCK
jgi:hypothetical protein